MRRRMRIFVAVIFALSGLAPGVSTAQSGIPGWLAAHVGTGEGQIAPVVLERARGLYRDRVRRGQVKNPCYMAMDATRAGGSRRYYTICEAQKVFRAVSSGHGNGRKLQQANFANGRQCARHFSNAEGSKLTMGGDYITAETRTSFKGYIRQSGKLVPFHRTFLLFDGTGETSNARERAIGGHQAVFVKWQCRMQMPQSPYADKAGYVPVGRLVDYTGGRSNGCTTWSGEATREILRLTERRPTTLYIYPEGKDIEAVEKVARAGASVPGNGLYWNNACLREIGAPKFWPKRKLQPVINRWRRSLPKSEPRELPICG
ncbi:murein L,D-transpeptidase catalytic domain family protein [Vannielia litorea]|uniref:murein L,D-transpeptidase catalytic domain family protein n=1 Tax=Vannielia litorea TaxID=1217970 RepID=UPI0021BDE668|nr:murein L,D-transpeptidase catalytic domain family protein [Vannielia litorea]